ncbi:hypothetical protein Lser_V15G29986 [Lactuca serriola]
MLSRYRHENLISLLGFCDEDGEKILVYEHASHGSLDLQLSRPTLTWRQRLKICLGAAMGLSYLHDPKGTQQRVLHRDIKSSNILLDENWNAKVSDMRLSKIGPANQQHTFLVSNVVDKSRDERPKMCEVVEKLEIALRFQEIFEESLNYEEIIKTAIPPLVYRSLEELKMFLSKGIFLNRGRLVIHYKKNLELLRKVATESKSIAILLRNMLLNGLP